MKSGTLQILVVDDERPIRRFLRTALSAEGYQVVDVATGEDAIATVTRQTPDLIILDLGLPDISGLEVTSQLREWTEIPIIILSVLDGEKDKIAALDAGANDYVTKPFGMGELLARMRAALRYSMQAIPSIESGIFKSGGMEVDFATRTVLAQGKPVQLTPTEYDLLRTLISHAGKVLTHNQLFLLTRGVEDFRSAHLLHVHMSNLRRKLEPDPNRPRYILTEPGVGYRLLADE